MKLDLEDTQEVVGIRGDSENERVGKATYAFSSIVENEVVERDVTTPHIRLLTVKG